MALVIETARLEMREVALEDAAFVLELLNDADFLRYIGDRGVHSLESAHDYILKGPVASYQNHGFGLYLVRERATGNRIGMCGLLRRDVLEGVDIGFAYLPAYRMRGYAFEAAAATLERAHRVLGIQRVLAIVQVSNAPSIRLLEKLGFRFERMIRMPGDDFDIRVYAWNAPS